MATSSFPTVTTGVTVETATAGALSGDGSSGNKLAVGVDGVTVTVNGDNQLVAAGGGGTPASPSGSIQFNDSGAFGGGTDLQWIDNSDGYGANFYINVPSASQDVVNDWQGYAGVLIGPNPTSGASGIGIIGGSAGEPELNFFGNAGTLTVPVAVAPGGTVGTFRFHNWSGSAYEGPGGYVSALLQGSSNLAFEIQPTGGASGGLMIGWDFTLVGTDGYAIPGPANGTAIAELYFPNLNASSDHSYGFWQDSRTPDNVHVAGAGVFRVNGLGIAALYNPDFATQYDPGAQSFERLVLGQWDGSNVAQIGTETGPTQTLSSVTSVTTTATATLTNHGYRTGDAVVIAGANQSPYNGTYTVTKIDDDSFSYTFGGSGTSPATGTITAQSGTLRALKLLGSAVSTAAVFQAGGYKSSDGSVGASAGPFTVITAITVKNGLITSITGS